MVSYQTTSENCGGTDMGKKDEKQFKCISFMEAMQKINDGHISEVYFSIGTDFVCAEFYKVDLRKESKRNWYLKHKK